MKTRKLIAFLMTLTMIVLMTGACSSQETPAASTTTKAAAVTTQAASTPAETTPAKLDYPKKNLTLIIGFEAGGTTDIAARKYVQYWQKYFPKDIACLNIAGSGGAIAANEAMQKPNDGYTLMVQSGPFPMNYALGSSKFTYEDFEPVGMMFESYMALCVKADSPIKTYEEFVANVKAAPDKSVKYGVFSGSPMMSVWVVLEKELQKGFHVIDLPGSAKATELLAGRIDAYSDAFAQMKPYIDSGEFRCLGIFAPERLKDYPNIPTMKEFGYNYPITDQRYGLWAIKGTDQAIVDYLSSTMKQANDDADLQAEFKKMVYNPVWLSVADYTAWLKSIYSEYPKYVDAIKGTK